MIKNIFLLLLCTPLVLFAQEITIIPQPVSVVKKQGFFVVDSKTSISFNSTDKQLKAAADLLSTYIKTGPGIDLQKNTSGKIISFKLGKTAEIGTEGYLLNVKSNEIIITANTAIGVGYGVQTLIQILEGSTNNSKKNIALSNKENQSLSKNGSNKNSSDQNVLLKSNTVQIPALEIKDYPRFKWRGMHLDVSRHFYPVSFVKKYIDFLAFYKFNRFHWHLTDDQGWRIEIKKYPGLTTYGSSRNGTIIGKFPGTANNNLRYGGFYTQEEVKEVVAYAAARNVTVVPEIEMPGHASAAIAAFPFLSCFPGKPTQIPGPASARSQLLQAQGDIKLVQETWGVFEDIFCAGKDSTFLFLQDVLSEVLQLFPSKYIHVGGDEAPKDHWKICPNCQSRIKSENLKDEHELQNYFITRMEKYLNSKGRVLIGWDEILEGGLAPNAVVMSWRGEAGGIEAAKMNHDVIMTPGNPVYFDHYQGDPASEPLAFGGFNSLKKVYDYEPVPKELNAQQSKYILGAQANLWTEYIPTTQHVEYMVLPRMLALSEVVWSKKEDKNWDSFNKRLQTHFSSFERKGWNFAPGNFKVEVRPSSETGKLSVNLSTEAYGGEIYYTIDGTNPTLKSNRYEGPVNIERSVLLKAVAAVNGRVMSSVPAEQAFVMHKAIGRKVKYLNPASQYYPADGPNSLTDGIRGTTAANKFWHGLSGKDLIATIDLGEEKLIKGITLGTLQSYRDWILLPQSVKFEISNDGVSYTEIQTIPNTLPATELNATIKDFTVTFNERKAKFVRVTAKPNVLPAGHAGAGKGAWIFVDEVVVK